MKVEVAVLGSPSLCGREETLKNRPQETRESGGGHPGLPVPNRPYGLCGRKATLNCFGHFIETFAQPNLRCKLRKALAK